MESGTAQAPNSQFWEPKGLPTKLILYGTGCASWTWVTLSFPWFGNFQLLCLQIFSQALSFFSFWDLFHANIISLILSLRSLKLSSFLFVLFFCSVVVISMTRPVLFLFSLLLFPSSVYFISVILLYFLTLCLKLLASHSVHSFSQVLCLY